jgi:hypothetical protein
MVQAGLRVPQQYLVYILSEAAEHGLMWRGGEEEGPGRKTGIAKKRKPTSSAAEEHVKEKEGRWTGKMKTSCME